MAKYTVKFSCGHENVMQLFGKEKDRQSKIEYFERYGLCPECYKAKMEREREIANKEAMEKAKNLPALTGSPKQIVWATTIRQKFLDYVYANYEKTEENSEEMEESMDKILSTYTDSAHWIESRNFVDRDSFLIDMLRELGYVEELQ